MDEPTPTPRTAPPCPSCDAPGASWLPFTSEDGAFQCARCHCVWMVHPPSLWYRRHANGATVAVTAKADLGQDCYMAGAEPPGQPDWHALVFGLKAAKRAADEASGCPQPCFCAPWPD